MSKYGIMYGGLRQTILIGRLNKANTEMLDDKEDHILRATSAVVECVLDKYNGSMELVAGDKRYIVKVTVEPSKEPTHGE